MEERKNTNNKQQESNKDKWKRVVLTLFIITVSTVALYLIVTPFIPTIEFYVRERFDREYDSIDEDKYIDLSGRDATTDDEIIGENVDVEVSANRVVINKIGVDMPIVYGSDESALDQGSWLRPTGSTPGRGSNTVLTAHRFSYTSGDYSFYHLDKVEVGDIVDVYWKGEKHSYEVKDTFIVDPEQVEIENPTSSEQLTLYTCTPLWTAAQRLVVIADPV